MFSIFNSATSKIFSFIRENPRLSMMVSLIMLVIVMIAYRCHSLDMVWDMSLRYWLYAIPSLFSELYYGAAHYTYLPDIADEFAAGYPYQSTASAQSMLDAVIKLPANSMRAAILFPADEKGTVDFVRFAFKLFGTHIESIFYFAMSIFTVSVTFFVSRYRKDMGMLFIIVFALISFYVALNSFAVTRELHGITNPRAIGCLSIFALLHLAFLTIRGEKLTYWHIPEIIFQSALLIMIVSMRTAEAWQIVALGAVSVISLFYYRKTIPNTAKIMMLAPLVCVIAFQACYYQYQNYTFPAGYFSHNTRNKIFWHNVMIGIALNPKLASDYNLKINDSSVLKYVKNRAKNNKDVDYEKIFFPENMSSYGMVIDFRQYDLLCKKEFWQIARHNKYQMIKLVLYYKPIQLLHTMQYLMSQNKRSLTYYNLYDQASSLLTNEQRTEKSAFFRPFTFIPLFIIALGLGIASDTNRFIKRLTQKYIL